MGRAIAVFAHSAATYLPHPLAPFARFWRELTWHMFDDYRPERHYMRGPGPAWRKKHGQPNRPA
jgi:hypothetical protein